MAGAVSFLLVFGLRNVPLTSSLGMLVHSTWHVGAMFERILALAASRVDRRPCPARDGHTRRALPSPCPTATQSGELSDLAERPRSRHAQ